jgi:hypothetical protein
MNIYKKLLEIQKKIISLKKDKTSFQYAYLTGDKLLDYIKPIMNEQGLILKQEVVKVEKERILYKTKTAEKEEVLYSVWQKFTWIDCETGEKDENEFFATGMNDWEKGLGSALTYAERYFIMKYFHISTDEDDIDNQDRKQEPKKQELVTLEPIIKELKKAENAKVSAENVKYIYTLLNKVKFDYMKIYEAYKVQSMKDLTAAQATKVVEGLRKIEKEQEEKK